MFVVTFCLFNIGCNRGLRSMIFYGELVILECDSRHSLSCYFFRYPNLIRHQTIRFRTLRNFLNIRKCIFFVGNGGGGESACC